MTSIYSELLGMSLTLDGDAPGAAPSTERRLLEELTEYRHRLQATGTTLGTRRGDASSRIATELQYDRTLIKLCRLHGIPCEVGRFARPLQERMRLEKALGAAGVPLR
jgi:hypothetical protein